MTDLRTVLFAASVFFSGNTLLCAVDRMPLWPEGKMPHRQLKENGADAQGSAYLEWYIPAKLTTKSIQIIYSGGAYVGNSPNGFEVAPMRRFLNEKGWPL